MIKKEVAGCFGLGYRADSSWTYLAQIASHQRRASIVEDSLFAMTRLESLIAMTRRDSLVASAKKRASLSPFEGGARVFEGGGCSATVTPSSPQSPSGAADHFDATSPAPRSGGHPLLRGKGVAQLSLMRWGSGRSGFVRSLTFLLPLLLASTAYAYPEFEQYIDQTSGRYVNCSLCHTHPEGPEGVKPGQIGSLTPQEMEQLNRARAAFEPGQNLDNPILNKFGDDIIRQLGKTEFLQYRTHPEDLARALDPESDLDGDTIPDVEEFAAGTHPLDPRHGEPTRLFMANLRERWVHVALLIIATGLGLYGISGLLHGFDARLRAMDSDEELN